MLNLRGIVEENELSRSVYYRAGSISSFIEHICASLEHLGVKKVQVAGRYNLETLRFPETTLLCLPVIEGFQNYPNALLKQQLKNRFRKFDAVLSTFLSNQLSVPILDKEQHTILKYNDLPIAVYYPVRRCLILFFNIFAIERRKTFAIEIFKLLQEIISHSSDTTLKNIFTLTIIPPVPLTPEEIQTRHELALLKTKKQFFDNIELSKLQNFKDLDIITNEIHHTANKLTDLYKESMLKQIAYEALKSFTVNFESTFDVRVNSIKELKFVKEVSFNSTGINVHVGDISITVKGVKTYLGDYTIIISANSVKFSNTKTPKLLSNIHPHILSDGVACFASFRPEVEKLRVEQRFKELVFLCYQFLNTYTHNTANRPYTTIEEWVKSRMQENKYDDTGHLIVASVNISVTQTN